MFPNSGSNMASKKKQDLITEKSHGSAVSLVVMANENPTLPDLCVLEERQQQKCLFFQWLERNVFLTIAGEPTAHYI